MKRFLPFLLVSTLFSESTTVESGVKPCNWQPKQKRDCWHFTSSLGLGYRFDRQKFDYKNSRTLNLDNLNSVQTNLSLLFDYDHVLLRFAADYAWLVAGSCYSKSLTPLERYSSSPVVGGYTADAQALLSCRVRFLKNSNNCVTFIPGLGLNYSHMNIVVGGQQFSFTPTTFSAITFTRPLQQDYFGPVVEGKMEFNVGRWCLDLFWQYMHVGFRQVYSFVQENFSYSMGTLVNGFRSSIHQFDKNNNLRTQLGGADLSYRSPNQWQIGTHFEGSSSWFKSARSRSTTKMRDLSVPTAPSSTLSDQQLAQFWVSYRAHLYASYWF